MITGAAIWYNARVSCVGKVERNSRNRIGETDELMLNWKLCMEGKDVVWVDPIR